MARFIPADDASRTVLHGYQVIGRDWRYIYVSPAAGVHASRKPHHLVGRLVSEAYPGIDQTDLFAVLHQCMMGGPEQTFENQFTFPDGTRRWFEIRVQPLPEGIGIHSLDIQDRKDVERANRRRRRLTGLRQRSMRASLGRIWVQCARVTGLR